MSGENLLPVGTHDVRIVSHVLSKASTGTPCVVIDVEDKDARRLRWYGYLSERAVEGTIERLQDIGWDADAADWQIESLNGTTLLVDKPCQVVVEDEEYEGKIRRKVKYLNPPGGRVSETMEPAEAKSFSNDLRKRLIASRGPRPNRAPSSAAKPAAKKPSPAPVAKTTEQFDSDIPF